MATTPRPLRTAELLSIGSELTVGDTRDTNSGDIARELTAHGVAVGRVTALPDDLDVVTGAFADALARADVVISTGGLGPTPDDLTREALSAVCGETPAVDHALEEWLRGLWARRGMPFPELNLKQAWLIPSATAIPNPNGTAPGWWVDRPDGRVAVALPGPPREMQPMWSGWVLPRLEERGLGRDFEARTLRLQGIGESQAADLLGEAILRAPNPQVATYARVDAVDVRIAAVGTDGRSARELAEEAEAVVLERLGRYVWARGGTSWPDAIGAALAERGWTLATTERGTGGSLATLIGALDALRLAEIRGSADDDGDDEDHEAAAVRVRDSGGADVGVALRILARGDDTAVSVAIALPDRIHRERRLAFLGGAQGRHRAALACADILLAQLRQPVPAPTPEAAR